MPTLKIFRLGKIGNVEWFDFEQVPQGYIHICGTPIPKPKGSRKLEHINGSLVNPTDEQVIEHAKKLNARNPEPKNYDYVICNVNERDSK